MGDSAGAMEGRAVRQNDPVLRGEVEDEMKSREKAKPKPPAVAPGGYAAVCADLGEQYGRGCFARAVRGRAPGHAALRARRKGG